MEEEICFQRDRLDRVDYITNLNMAVSAVLSKDGFGNFKKHIDKVLKEDGEQ